jgi:predicted Zn-dependent protease
MEEAGGSGPPQFLSTHPAPVNRQETLARIAPKYMELYQLPGTRPIYQFKD